MVVYFTDIENADFQLWEGVSRLRFEETTPGSEDISIYFVTGEHSQTVGIYYNESPFDGPGKVLAHAFFPSVGDAHFDDDENFTDRERRGELFH